MVRRHLLPPGKFQTFQSSSSESRPDTMARIIPKSLNLSLSQNTTANTSMATIHLSNNLKCPVRNVLLHGNLTEALASEMMPPPPPPPFKGGLSTFSPPKSVTSVTNNLLLPQEGEVEFYKAEVVELLKCGGSSSSEGSASHDDFDDEDSQTAGMHHLGRKNVTF